MSVNSIDDTYLSATAQTQLLQQAAATSSVTAVSEDVSSQTGTATAVSKTDSYFSGISSSEDAIPTGTYNSSGTFNDESSVSSSTSGTSESTDSEESQAVSSSGSGSGSGSGESETSTEVISINGVSFLQTTTTENGVTTVTREQL